MDQFVATATDLIMSSTSSIYIWPGVTKMIAGYNSWVQLIVYAIAGLLGLLLALYVYMLWPALKLRHVPCPPYSWPGLGHLPLLAKHEAETFIKLKEQYGPIFRFHWGRTATVMIADAELCREIGVKQFKKATDRIAPTYIRTAPFLPNGLFWGKGKKWTALRSIVVPLYHTEQMRKYVPLMSRVIGYLVKQVEVAAEDKKDLNISDCMALVAAETIGEAAFGTKYGLLEGKIGEKMDESRTGGVPMSMDKELIYSANRFVNALRVDGNAPLSTIIGELFPFLQWPMRKTLRRVPGTADWQMETEARHLQKVVASIVAKREQQGNLDSKLDMLSLLLKAKHTSPELLDQAHIDGLTFEMQLVGSETTAVSISYALYLISSHPEVEKKMLREIDSFGPPTQQPTFEDLERFPYVEQVMKESLRILTPAPTIARELSEDTTLGPYHLKKGTSVWIALNAVMQDPQHYKDPQAFRPERFEPDSLENKERHPFAYAPFGLGPRTCMGYKFAMQEARLALILLYQRFTFEHSPIMENPLTFNYGIVRRPKNGIWLRAHPRHVN